jgi:hypothetical protein
MKDDVNRVMLNKTEQTFALMTAGKESESPVSIIKRTRRPTAAKQRGHHEVPKKIQFIKQYH